MQYKETQNENNVGLMVAVIIKFPSTNEIRNANNDWKSRLKTFP